MDYKNYFNLAKLTVRDIICTGKIVNVGTSNPGESGLPAQRFYSLQLVEQMAEGELESSGLTLRKTVFENAHPGAFVQLEKLEDAGQTDVKKVKGNLYIVPTKRWFTSVRRDDKGNLVPNIDTVTGKPRLSNSMRIFLFNDERLESELIRRMNQLTKQGFWQEAISEESAESGEDLHESGIQLG